jgi:hypothetical protein
VDLGARGRALSFTAWHGYGISVTPELPGVAPEITEWDCDRDNGLILSPDLDATELHLQLIRKERPEASMDPGTYITRIGPDDVDVDVAEARGLYVEISTGCVDRNGLPRLRDDLTTVAKAMGAG